MDNTIIDENQLIKKAKNDPESFGVLYDRYFERIFRFILARTGDHELAQDLTAETFFSALKLLWRFRLLGKPFSAWLYKIARTQIANFYRQKSKYCEISLEEFPDLFIPNTQNGTRMSQLEENQPAWEKFKELHSLLYKLKPVQHDIIVLHYMEEKKLDEVGRLLDMKLNTVKSHLRRGMMRLRNLYFDKALPGYENYEEHRSKFNKLFKTNEAEKSSDREL